MDIENIITLSSKIILAPLAGLSDPPFRIINRRMGFRLAFLEMVHARSLVAGSRKTKELMRSDKQRSPLGLQLLCNETDYLQKAIDKLQEYKYDVLDLNAACPARKVVAKEEGAALLNHPKKIKSLLKVMVKHANTPVTVKIRLGWDNADKAVDIAKHCEDAGIAALFVHGRTKIQGYSGGIDYKKIAGIKRSLKIPVIASGNILSAELALNMFEYTGCDAVLVARGALGNPWIFKEIRARLLNRKIPARPEIEQIAKVMRQHFELCLKYAEDLQAVRRFRKFFVWYTRGINNIKDLRIKVMTIKSSKDMLTLIEEFNKKGEKRI